jgi:hypothetical protein
VFMSLGREEQTGGSEFDLDEEEKGHIREVFFEQIVPKLTRLHARKGTIGCGFAGIRYRKWTIQFDSRRSGFEILGFEYDEDAGGVDLDL